MLTIEQLSEAFDAPERSVSASNDLLEIMPNSAALPLLPGLFLRCHNQIFVALRRPPTASPSSE